MRPFAFIEPGSVDEAAAALAAPGGPARLLAGGVDLLGELKEDLVEAAALVDLKAVRGLSALRFEPDGTLRIGALVTLAALSADPRVRRDFPAIAQAAESVGSPEIRNVGTVGGNLCQRPRCWYYRSAAHRCLKKGGDVCFTVNGESRYNAILGGGPSFIVHPSDLAPALAACRARILCASPGGRREIAIEDFYVLPEVRLDHETTLRPAEIVTEVTVPAAASTAAGVSSLFLKFKEKDSMDFALASVALAATLREGRLRDPRLVLGGVAPVPWRAREAEQALDGSEPTEAAAGAAADAALARAVPLEHNAYKIPLAKGLIREAIDTLVRGAGGMGGMGGAGSAGGGAA
jgi:xanthine dehydrogenase YagS FAD-binding subunit